MVNFKNEYYLRLIFVISLISIISAYFIEYILGYQPCNLCLIERIPYGLSIFLIITVMTFIFEPDAYVRFGVLHLLAFASLFAFPLVRRPVIAFIFGLFFLFVPLFSNENLVWIGMSKTGLSAVDYFPLNPWLGVFLICIGLSSQIYSEGKSLIKIQWPEKWLLLGKNTLIIYVFHQPFLIALLIITGLVPLNQIIP